MAKSSRSPPDIFHPDGRLCLDLFLDRLHSTLRSAVELTKQTRWDSVRSPHLFMALLNKPDADILQWADLADLEISDLLTTFHEMFYEPAGNPSPLLALHREFLSDNCIRFLRSALLRAVRQKHEKITSIDLLVSLLTEPESIIIECLNVLDLEPGRLVETARQLDAQKDVD